MCIIVVIESHHGYMLAMCQLKGVRTGDVVSMKFFEQDPGGPVSQSQGC